MALEATYFHKCIQSLVKYFFFVIYVFPVFLFFLSTYLSIYLALFVLLCVKKRSVKLS